MTQQESTRIYGYVPFEGFKNSSIEYDIENVINGRKERFCKEHGNVPKFDITIDYTSLAKAWCEGFMQFLEDRLYVNLDYDFVRLDKDCIGTMFTTDGIVAAISTESLQTVLDNTNKKFLDSAIVNKNISEWTKEDIEEVLGTCASDYDDNFMDIIDWCDYMETIENNIEVSYKGVVAK